MRFTLIRLILAAIFILAAYKWGDWKNWKQYYSTMMFFGFGDLIYHVVFEKRHLWEFQLDYIAGPINELFVIFTIFFATTLLFLSNYPKKFYHQVIYISFWVAIYMLIEILTLRVGMLKYYNGWNLWWSLLHNYIQFLLLALHHKRPLLAWTIAIIFLYIIMSVFNVPLTINR
jgi:hypothetical protein